MVWFAVLCQFVCNSSPDFVNLESDFCCQKFKQFCMDGGKSGELEAFFEKTLLWSGNRGTRVQNRKNLYHVDFVSNIRET
mmetsp:Transcript_3062/g.5778  ORF Transcript_3062/g.5778 Transcript_3062/m.5778 type:complete len:80 (+) Transcript_3062:491-730(+)